MNAPFKLAPSSAATRADVEVVTFGCRLNAYESEGLKARAAADGLTDAVVFNTCAVTGEAVRQARQAIRKARRERPDARIVVTGCAAQIDPAAFAAMPEVDLVLGNADKGAVGAPAGHVDAGQHHLAIALGGQALDLGHDLAGGGRARIPASIGDDAEGAAVVAAVLHFDIGPRAIL